VVGVLRSCLSDHCLRIHPECYGSRRVSALSRVFQINRDRRFIPRNTVPSFHRKTAWNVSSHGPTEQPLAIIAFFARLVAQVNSHRVHLQTDEVTGGSGHLFHDPGAIKSSKELVMTIEEFTMSPRVHGPTALADLHKEHEYKRPSTVRPTLHTLTTGRDEGFPPRTRGRGD